MSWEEFTGDLPETVAQHVGEVPYHDGNAFWMKVGSVIMVAGTPPASVFPPGHWTQVHSAPAGTTFGPAVVKSGYRVAISSNSRYVQISSGSVKNSSVYVKQMQPLVLHGLAGAPRRVGAAGDSAVTAQAVVAYFIANPCTQDSVPVVTAFQNDWNDNNPTDLLQVDGQYGPLTQGAIQNALGTTNVPPNCFGGATTAPTVVPPNPGPLPAPSPTPSSGGSSSSSSPVPYIIAALIVAGGLAAYATVKQKNKKRHAHG